MTDILNWTKSEEIFSAAQELMPGGVSSPVRAFKSVGGQPIVFDNLSTGLRENLFPEIPFIHGDLMIPEQIHEAMKDVRAVIHLPALKAAGDSMVEAGILDGD